MAARLENGSPLFPPFEQLLHDGTDDYIDDEYIKIRLNIIVAERSLDFGDGGNIFHGHHERERRVLYEIHRGVAKIR